MDTLRFRQFRFRERYNFLIWKRGYDLDGGGQYLYKDELEGSYDWDYDSNKLSFKLILEF